MKILMTFLLVISSHALLALDCPAGQHAVTDANSKESCVVNTAVAAPGVGEVKDPNCTGIVTSTAPVVKQDAAAPAASAAIIPK